MKEAKITCENVSINMQFLHRMSLFMRLGQMRARILSEKVGDYKGRE